MVFTLAPQQSPPSYAHPQLLLSSSQKLSPFHWGEPQVPGQSDGGGAAVVAGGGVGDGDSPQTFPISAIKRICCYK